MRRLIACLCLLIVTTFAHAQVTPASEQKSLDIVSLDGKVTHVSVADLEKYRQVSAPVTADDGTKTVYSGPLLRDVLLKVGILSSGPHIRGRALHQIVLVSARDGYSVPFTIGEIDSNFGNLKMVLAIKMDGKPLFNYEGPFRLAIPTDKEGARSVRMVSSIKVVRLEENSK